MYVYVSTKQVLKDQRNFTFLKYSGMPSYRDAKRNLCTYLVSKVPLISFNIVISTIIPTIITVIIIINIINIINIIITIIIIIIISGQVAPRLPRHR